MTSQGEVKHGSSTIPDFHNCPPPLSYCYNHPIALLQGLLIKGSSPTKSLLVSSVLRFSYIFFFAFLALSHFFCSTMLKKDHMHLILWVSLKLQAINFAHYRNHRYYRHDFFSQPMIGIKIYSFIS